MASITVFPFIRCVWADLILASFTRRDTLCPVDRLIAADRVLDGTPVLRANLISVMSESRGTDRQAIHQFIIALLAEKIGL